MTDIKSYDLEDRTFQFARRVREFVKKLPKTVANFKDGEQLVRSSGSVAANFIESIEALSDKDSLYRKKICRKEAKESRLWLGLIDTREKTDLENERADLRKESDELMKIFGSIICKRELSLKNLEIRV